MSDNTISLFLKFSSFFVANSLLLYVDQGTLICLIRYDLYGNMAMPEHTFYIGLKVCVLFCS